MPHVLLVDDNEENLYLLECLMRGKGYLVNSARNGAEALDIALKVPPDLIISDILMPVMDGFELCREWKRNSRLMHIPFVFYTATYIDPKDEAFALSLGADMFIVKPKEPMDFISIVDTVLANHRAGELTATAAEPASESVYLKQYNAALIRKLQDKLDQLGQANRALAQKEVFSLAILNSMAAQIAVVNEKGEVVAVNQNWHDFAKGIETPSFMHADIGTLLFETRITGSTADKSIFEQQVADNIRSVLAHEQPEYEIDYSCRVLGEEHWFLLRVTPLKKNPGAVLAYFDITAGKLLEERLRSALLEKETLLSELFHRTKNNMQVIYSMLELQCQYSKSKCAKQIFRDTELRIQVLSLVHQQLYRSQNLSRIDLREYLTNLSHLLATSYAVPENKIALVLDVDRELVLFDIALPVGLVVNELLTNALKHGFPGDKRGRIRLALHRLPSGELQLEITDNGVGVTRDFDFEKSRTLGFQLIGTIVKRQLRGTVEFKMEQGVHCSIRFKGDLYEERV